MLRLWRPASEEELSIWTAGYYSTYPDEKRGRSSTGLCSPVAGSNGTQRADPTSGGQDGSDGWTVVKRKKKGKKSKQQEYPTVDATVTGEIRGLMESPLGSQPVQEQTEGLGRAAGLETKASTGPTKPRQHPSKRQRRKKE